MWLTIYLLRNGAVADQSVLRSKATVTNLSFRVDDPKIRNAFFLQGESVVPKWLKDLESLVVANSSSAEYERASLGAVVLVESGDRVVAVTFGTGFLAIEPSWIERGFGLRVVANGVSARRLRGVQTRVIASNSRDQYTLLPVDGELADLRIEVDEDWLRQMSGKATDQDFASTIAGADSLRIAVPKFDLSRLSSKIDKVLEIYSLDDYKEHFSFLDQIVPLDKSNPVVEVLDNAVGELLRDGSTDVSFAPPDPFDMEALDHYELVLGHKDRYSIPDVDHTSVIEAIDALSPEKSPLEDVMVYAVDADGSAIQRGSRLKAYARAEVSHEGNNYLLSSGLWFEVEKNFVKKINADLSDVEDITNDLNLPPWVSEFLKEDEKDKTKEGSYNIITAEDRKYALLDKNLVVFSQYERLEICDLLTPDAELLCVKAATDSSSLSHLVAQVENSARAWEDELYQAKLAEAWGKICPGQAAPARSNAKFVLAIATDRPGSLSESLFFFAKVQVAHCVKAVRRAGFKVALARIEVESGPATKVEKESSETK
ncbi:DUF6119 family protein [Kribbella deserti]|uniref:DUF6119 family protein n=1 Tax=Kribbella deserti TaxID=1926257 RepID=A0ABV6QHF6_9ACTN